MPSEAESEDSTRVETPPVTPQPKDKTDEIPKSHDSNVSLTSASYLDQAVFSASAYDMDSVEEKKVVETTVQDDRENGRKETGEGGS